MPSVVPHDHCSFKLHATSRQLHEWTRTENTKAKERSPQMMKEEKADLCSEKSSSTQAETFEGEMDNFQTPLVRRGVCHSFTYVHVADCSAGMLCIQLSSLVPLVGISFWGAVLPFSLDRG
jgi:hypothetical protein